MCLLTGEGVAAVKRKSLSCEQFPILRYREKNMPPREELMELRYGQRMMMHEIAEHYDYSGGAITAWFRHYDIPEWTGREIGRLRHLTNKLNNPKNITKISYYERKLDEFWEEMGAKHGYAPRHEMGQCEGAKT
jgi:hypothetical protein